VISLVDSLSRQHRIRSWVAVRSHREKKNWLLAAREKPSPAFSHLLDRAKSHIFSGFAAVAAHEWKAGWRKQVSGEMTRATHRPTWLDPRNDRMEQIFWVGCWGGGRLRVFGRKPRDESYSRRGRRG
jgi:hypothetical protein